MREPRDRMESTAREFRRELNALLDQLHGDVPDDVRRDVVKTLSRSLASARAVFERNAPQPSD
jgi:hypothetical protein